MGVESIATGQGGPSLKAVDVAESPRLELNPDQIFLGPGTHLTELGQDLQAILVLADIVNRLGADPQTKIVYKARIGELDARVARMSKEVNMSDIFGGSLDSLATEMRRLVAEREQLIIRTTNPTSVNGVEK